MSPYRFAFALVLALLGAGRPAFATEIEILTTTDLHGHLEHGADDNTSGGWLRLATLIRRERATVGENRTLLIDCGDTTQGTFAAAESRGEIGLIALKALRYDVWVPGNHEFDYGLPRLREFVAATPEIGLAGNLEMAQPANRGTEAAPTLTDRHTATPPDGQTVSFRRLPAWKLFARGGVRIAVIGVTASYLDQWFWTGNSPGYRVEKAVATLTLVLLEVHRAKPDVIVLAAHQGWLPNDPRGVNELAEIAKRFPEIDLILGGHTHQPFPGQKIGFKTWYVQAGRQASVLGVVKLSVDTTKHEVTDIQSELRAAGADVPLDQALDDATRDLRQSAGTPGRDCATADLVCRAMMRATGAKAAFHGKFTETGLAAGPVTGFDLYRLLPFENGITVAQLTPAEILKVQAEQEAEIVAPKIKNNETVTKANGLCGLRTGPAGGTAGAKILLDAAGKALPEGGRIPVAFNSYVAAGGGGRFPILRELLRQSEAKAVNADITTREALRQYLADTDSHTTRR